MLAIGGHQEEGHGWGYERPSALVWALLREEPTPGQVSLRSRAMLLGSLVCRTLWGFGVFHGSWTWPVRQVSGSHELRPPPGLH